MLGFVIKKTVKWLDVVSTGITRSLRRMAAGVMCDYPAVRQRGSWESSHRPKRRLAPSPAWA